MHRYSEEDVAAEEKRIGGRLPDELRGRLLEGVPDEVVLKTGDGAGGAFQVWGPSTTATDKKGRERPTSGMAQETDAVRQSGEDLLGDDVLVAWGADDNGDLAVVLRGGTLGWWALRGGDVEPVEVLWDPSSDDLSRVEAGERL